MTAPRSAVTDPNCKTLWVGDVQQHWDEATILNLFPQWCRPLQVRVIRGRVTATGYTAGYGFLEFESREHAEHVLDTYNNTLIPGANGVRFRLNWGGAAAGNGQRRAPREHYSLFVCDLASSIDDFSLQSVFSIRRVKLAFADGIEHFVDPIS